MQRGRDILRRARSVEGGDLEVQFRSAPRGLVEIGWMVLSPMQNADRPK